MTSNPTRALGFRFHARHLLIVVTYFAILLGVLVPVLRHYGSSGMINGPQAILLVSPWLLGILVLLVERKGPVKYWAAPLLLSATSPALAICHNWLILEAWRSTGVVPHAIISLLINVVLVGTFSLFFASMYPGCCPRCGHRALIPLRTLWGGNSRTPKTRWCGSCGAQYWRDNEGLWQKERRATWIDSIGPAGAEERTAGSAPAETPEEGTPSAQPGPYTGPSRVRPGRRSPSSN
jgi:hypothetical protein